AIVSRLPKRAQHHQARNFQFTRRLNHKMQEADRPISVLLGNAAKRLCHPQQQVFGNRQTLTLLCGKLVQERLDQPVVGIARIHPLSYAKHHVSRSFLLRLELLELASPLLQNSKALLNLSLCERLVEGTREFKQG